MGEQYLTLILKPSNLYVSVFAFFSCVTLDSKDWQISRKAGSIDGSLLSGLSLGLHVFILFTVLAPFYDISLCHCGVNVNKCFSREIRGSSKLAWQKCLPGGGGIILLLTNPPAVNKSTSIVWKEWRQRVQTGKKPWTTRRGWDGSWADKT